MWLSLKILKKEVNKSNKEKFIAKNSENFKLRANGHQIRNQRGFLPVTLAMNSSSLVTR